MIQLRCEDRVYNKVERPTICYDSDLYVILRWGEREFIDQYWRIAYDSYKENGFEKEANALCVMELPPDQELIDKLFNCTGYLKVFVEEQLNNILKD